MFKRVIVMLFCLMMVFIATFGFVVGVVAVPTIYSYAETTNNFEPIRDQSDAVYAFQYYCKSRDLTIEGSIADAVTSYTTDAYNYTCNKIGVNPTELQAQIQAEYDQSGKPIKFLFSATGIDVFNRLFSQFLQDNELEVGDTNVDKQVYSGEIFIDDDGNTCFVSVVNVANITSFPSGVALANIYVQGTPFISNGGYEAKSFYDSNANGSSNIPYFTFNYRQNSYTYNIRYASGSVTWYGAGGAGYYLYFDRNGNLTKVGYPSIIKGNSNYYYYGMVESDGSGSLDSIVLLGKLIDAQVGTNATVNLVSNTINNNVYEGDTIINYEGDTIIDEEPTTPGGTPPNWDIGGGGGTATDGNGNTWNIQFPDFELPDLNIDWSINGLGEKFPFSIPFDLVALVTVLNAEPQAPRFEGTVNFGFTTWNYDINLQQFDSVAQACRIAELLLLVVGLILVTRSIIKG